VGEDRSEEMSRYTVGEAADILGISTGAVRNRLSRGTLRSIKEGRTVYVLLPSDMPRDVKRDVADTPGGMPQPDGATLTSELRDRLRYVEGQLEAERLAHAEARRLLMAALERIPPQLEASEAPEAPESPETTADTPSSATAPPEPQEGAQRPWWRRMFGGG
jgi:hypothetical protein